MANEEVACIRRLVNSLRSNICPACGDFKKAKNTLCGSCFAQLAPNRRNALYRGFGEGYENAVREALVALGADEPFWQEQEDGE